MKAEVKKEWVAALRSGKYQQGRGQLRQHNEYCCLGVLCDIASKGGIGNWVDDVAFVTDKEGAEMSSLPASVRIWADLDRTDPIINGGSLSSYNDGVGKFEPHSFTEIADLIEAHL